MEADRTEIGGAGRYGGSPKWWPPFPIFLGGRIGLFYYSITQRGQDYLEDLNERSPGLSGHEWGRVAPRATVLVALRDLHEPSSSVEMYQSIPEDLRWHPEELGGALQY